MPLDQLPPVPTGRPTNAAAVDEKEEESMEGTQTKVATALPA